MRCCNEGGGMPWILEEMRKDCEPWRGGGWCLHGLVVIMPLERSV